MPNVVGVVGFKTLGKFQCFSECDWFRGILYRHMNFRSGDGFLFWVTVNKMGEAKKDPYAGDSSQSVTLDLSQYGDPYDRFSVFTHTKNRDLALLQPPELRKPS